MMSALGFWWINRFYLLDAKKEEEIDSVQKEESTGQEKTRRKEKERCSGSFHLAVGFLVIAFSLRLITFKDKSSHDRCLTMI